LIDTLSTGYSPAFHVVDTSPEAQWRPKQVGVYRTTGWLPGNFLSEGTLIVGVALSTLDPVVIHFNERDCLAFQVVDSLDGNSARGSFAGNLPGVVRPMLEWTTTSTAAVPARASSGS
jgi:lipopolysaccharide transport system ATP-binding protein